MKWIKVNFKWIVIGLVAILAFFFVRSCGGPDAKYWVKKALYDQAVKDAAAQYAEDLAVINSHLATIASKDESIVASELRIIDLKKRIADLAATNGDLADEAAALKAEVQPVLDANPKVARLVKNLETQIENDKVAAFLLNQVIAEKDNNIADWTVKFNEQVGISETWKVAYGKERALRQMAEGLVTRLEHQGRSDRLIAKITTAGVAAAGAYLIINALKK